MFQRSSNCRPVNLKMYRSIVNHDENGKEAVNKALSKLKL